MILDERNEFCDATALNTGAAGSYLVADVIDLGATPGRPGDGVTLKFHLCSEAQAAMAADGSATYHFSTGVLAQATLVAGYRAVAVKLPFGTYERYLGILQTTAVEAVTAGKINAYLTPNVPANVAYPDAL